MSFDRIAPHYDWLEGLLAGGRLQRARSALLDRLSACQRVLSAGEGHGRFAAAFVRRYPGKNLVCVDACEPMAARARRRLSRIEGPTASVSWLVRELPDWHLPAGGFDAVVTCFFLDCFPAGQLGAVVGSLAAAAAPAALWLNADFAVPARGLARWRALAMHRSMYWFFRVTTGLTAHALTPPDAELQARGFRLDERREWEWGLIRADCWRRAAPVGR